MNSLAQEFLNKYESIDFERIVDHPNILIAACFWNEERYLAAKRCYKLMRYIDDYIDNYKTAHRTIAEKDKEAFTTQVNQWLNDIRNKKTDTQVESDLLECLDRFHIPLWPMEAFAKAMIYDIGHDGFDTLENFLVYAEGASVAPAAIFVHLAGLRPSGSTYLKPAFDVKKAAYSCAMFSYLVHIIRDFWKDQHNQLMYFADDILTRNGLARRDLEAMAKGAAVLPGFRSMMREYVALADTYRRLTYRSIQEIRPLMEPESQLSLDIVFNLYLMVFERIDTENGTFSTEELNPTTEEIRQRVLQTILNFSSAFN
jgi:phytoene/squalene synthetase